MSAPGFERLWDRAPFAVDFADGQGGDLVIAFSSVGHDPGRLPSPEFVGTATGRGTASAPRRALFVRDAARSWASDPGFAPALQAAYAQVTARAPVARLACIGLSMGGFAALAAMRVLPVDVALAFGPQFSPVLGGETRWRDWTARLSSQSLTDPLAGPGQGPGQGPIQGWACLFHGMQDDAAQAMAFPHTPGTDQLLFTDQNHASLVPHLKARGVLAGLMEAALAGDRRRFLKIAGSAGGVRRAA